MTKPTLPASNQLQRSRKVGSKSISGSNAMRRRARRKKDNSDVLVSAVISTSLLTHLHQILQRAEYGALQEGKTATASNFAQLRKVLCMDARSMKDASAIGMGDDDLNTFKDSSIATKAA